MNQTLINAIIAQKLEQKKLELDSKIAEIKKQIPDVVKNEFDKLNAEDSLDLLLSELESEYREKLANDVASITGELSKDYQSKSGDIISNGEKVITDFISSIEKPVDGYTPVKGKDYFDGEDYNLTEEDKQEIANAIVVEVPELKEKTADEILDLISGKIEISDIKGLEEKLKSTFNGKVIGAGGKTWYLKDLKDVDLSAVPIVDGKYVLGGESNARGWAYYADTQYTEASPFVVSNGSTLSLPNNADSSITGYLNGNPDLYDGSTINPWAVGDTLTLSIRFKVKSSANNGGIALSLDIGGTQGVIVSDGRRLLRGSNIEQKITFDFTTFCLDTFLANGGTISTESFSGNMSIYDINYLIVKQ